MKKRYKTHKSNHDCCVYFQAHLSTVCYVVLTSNFDCGSECGVHVQYTMFIFSTKWTKGRDKRCLYLFVHTRYTHECMNILICFAAINFKFQPVFDEIGYRSSYSLWNDKQTKGDEDRVREASFSQQFKQITLPVKWIIPNPFLPFFTNIPFSTQFYHECSHPIPLFTP